MKPIRPLCTKAVKHPLGHLIPNPPIRLKVKTSQKPVAMAVQAVVVPTLQVWRLEAFSTQQKLALNIGEVTHHLFCLSAGALRHSARGGWMGW